MTVPCLRRVRKKRKASYDNNNSARASVEVINLVAYSNSGLTKGDSQPPSTPPHHFTRMLDTIALDNQHEVIGNAEGMYHFEARAAQRQIANDAANYATPIERDRAIFQRVPPRCCSAFIQRKRPLESGANFLVPCRRLTPN